MTEISNTNESAPDPSDYIRAGRCIDGVAHSINNHLGAISGYIELLGMEEHVSSETRRMFNDMLACVHKSSELLGSLAGTVAARQTRVHLIDLCELVRQIIDVYHFEVHKARIEIELRSRGDCSPIPAVKGRLSRALMIIFRDAIERVRTAERRSIFVDIHGEDDAFSLVIRDSADTLPELRSPSDPEGVLDPNSLIFAREHVRFHGGELTFEPERGLLLRLPRANGLVVGKQVGENSERADAGQQALREG